MGRAGQRVIARGAGVAVALLATTWGLLAVALDQHGAVSVPAAKADAIVVLGCGTEDDGSLSPCLRRRTDAAMHLWRTGVAPLVVFTGGRTDTRPAESEVAAAYARSLGLPVSALRREAVSTSTWGNAEAVAPHLRGQTVVLVTDTFHAWRSVRVFGAHGMVATVRPVAASWLDRVLGSVREVAAVGSYGVEGRLGG